MDELEELKQQRLQQFQQAQLQRRYEEQLQQQQLFEQIQQLEDAVKSAMTKDALSRYGNLKSAHPEKAVQALVVIAEFLKQGKMIQVDDKTFKQVLMMIQPAKKDFKITRK